MEAVIYVVGMILFAYLLGSIPFGKIVGLRKGIDIQKHGSGNIGFANVLRTLGWRPALVVLAGDVGKGFLPTFLASSLAPHPLVAICAGIAAIAGHIFPVWLKGRGGKGIATGLGVTLALNPVLGLYGAGIYLMAFSWFRKSAPSSLLATWALPLICFAVAPIYFVYLYVGIALFITWAHRNNIRQMIAQKEYAR